MPTVAETMKSKVLAQCEALAPRFCFVALRAAALLQALRLRESVFCARVCMPELMFSMRHDLFSMLPFVCARRAVFSCIAQLCSHACPASMVDCSVAAGGVG